MSEIPMSPRTWGGMVDSSCGTFALEEMFSQRRPGDLQEPAPCFGTPGRLSEVTSGVICTGNEIVVEDYSQKTIRIEVFRIEDNVYLLGVEAVPLSEISSNVYDNLAFLEDALKEMIPVREILDRIRDVFVEYYHSAESRIGTGPLCLKDLLSSVEADLPKLYLMEGWEWIGA